MPNNKIISVIIPTLNAGDELHCLLEELITQTVVPDEIIVIDSSSTDNTVEIAKQYPLVDVEIIPRSEFNHGITRHKALLRAKGDIVCFLTQDAVPANKNFLERLINPLLLDKDVALSSGRQLPKKDAREFEKLVREFNYPPISNVRSLSDFDKYGIKTYFASDVCSAYSRDAYIKCGGFPKVDISEDMIMAARLIHNGYKVAYAADAMVFHSHNLTPLQQFRRNKAIGAFLQRYNHELGNVKETGEGTRLVKSVASRLLQKGKVIELLCFGIDCSMRLAGNRIGRINETKSSDVQ